MIFPLPPPIADLAIIDFALQDVDSQPLDPAGLEQGQEVLLAVFYTNAGGLPVFDARIELRVGDRAPNIALVDLAGCASSLRS